MEVRQLYPAIEPYRSGQLDVSDGQRVWWEECGNAEGTPLLVVHGGPGGGCVPDHRRAYDPSAYRIILFDQRGCGRSEPHASDPSVSLDANTTWHLVQDMERLRSARGRPVGAVRSLVGEHAGPRLCPVAPGPGHRDGPAQHLHAPRERGLGVCGRRLEAAA